MNPLRKLRDLYTAWKNRPEPPCTCHGCMPVETNNSRSMNVSHGLHMWVKDGKVHYRHKSRYVGGMD